jgi:flagellar motor switch protein FliM
MLNTSPDAVVELRSGSIALARGRIGRRNHSVAVRCEGPIEPAARQALKDLG